MFRTRIPLVRALLLLTLVGTIVAAGSGQVYARGNPQDAPSAGTTAAERDSPDFVDIDAFAQHAFEEMKIPGAAIGIVKGDTVLHLQSFGKAQDDGRLVTSSTPFKIGSNSKSFTALAVMQLVEQGRVRLDEPVRTYLPWFRVADSPDSGKITVRQLLNQTSGFSTASGLTYMYKENLGNDALEEQVRAAKSVELASRPGKKYHYSNLNYTVAGLIVQTVSGQPYEDYIQTHIFEPLRMNHSHAFLADAQKDGLAQGHQFWFDRPRAGGGMVNNRATTPAGLLSSSVEDMTHYLIAHLNGGQYDGARVLSPAGMAELHHGAAEISPKASYAMGWIAGELKGIPILGHNGETGDFHSTMALDPEGGWGVVVLMNGANDLDAGMDHVANGIMAKLLGVAAPKPPGTSANMPLLLVDALGILILLQLLAALWSVVLLVRWSRRSSTGRRRPGWVVARVVVAGVISLLWSAFVFLILPSALTLPLGLLPHIDMGWPMIISGTIALVWGVIAKPLLAAGVILRMRAAPPERLTRAAHAGGA